MGRAFLRHSGEPGRVETGFSGGLGAVGALGGGAGPFSQPGHGRGAARARSPDAVHALRLRFGCNHGHV